ncbi:MAG: [acyl-carrier-protein] S-malonyltransferase [Candidatus Pelagibacter sp. TMED273]|nr:MAG: [acyl-carrier-protein] S-malonyltransferase [Candidatus Pelagibacter sp. TMED273]|tara:strand:- start:3120 stop:4049 length:930 start_codon:yes stop_codon:yes gene_type:complete
MFAIIFPGQGSQTVGMCLELYKKFDTIKDTFKEADEVLKFPISELILNGPKEDLDLTENTQPAIFLTSLSIINLLKKDFKKDIFKAKYFAGHSLGEYSALASANSISFSDCLKILKIRGRSMQTSVPTGEGGMIAILGSKIETIEKLLIDNKSKYNCFVANDNSIGQIVVSGTNENINKLVLDLKNLKIRNIKLPVSAPFHCQLMNKATKIMNDQILKLNVLEPKTPIVSNVTAKEEKDVHKIKKLLVDQIESRVRWRESVLHMINNGVDHFIEIGPGKVLSSMIKRINSSVKISAINNEEDINNLKLI